jgi:hypothetical protein
VDTNMAGNAHGADRTEIRHERGYPAFDCAGRYLWIRERLIQTERGTQAVARQVRRGPTPGGAEAR